MDFVLVPAAYVVLRRDDAVLFQLRQNTGYRDGHWAVAAAGHVEKGESVRAAACREAAEELGIGIEPGWLRPLTAMHRTNSGADATGRAIDERVDFFFTCTRWTGEPEVREPAKNGGLRWCPLDAMPTPVVPHELQVLTALRSGTVEPITTFGF